MRIQIKIISLNFVQATKIVYNTCKMDIKDLEIVSISENSFVFLLEERIELILKYHFFPDKILKKIVMRITVSVTLLWLYCRFWNHFVKSLCSCPRNKQA